MTDSEVEICSKTLKWEELAYLPIGRSAHTAVLLGRVVFIGGGFEGHYNKDDKDSYRLDVYNLITNQWSCITTPYLHFAMTVLDGKIVIAGGRTKARGGKVVKKVLVLISGQWKDYSEMPTARSSATAIGYLSKLIVVGGSIVVEGQLVRVSTTELMDNTNGCWYTCDNIPSSHQQLKAAISNDKLYLLGGVDNNNQSPQVFVASLDTLSNHQLNWQSAPNTPWCCSTPVVLYNKFLLTVGGRQQSDVTNQTSEIFSVIPSTGEWKYLANIPAATSLPAVVNVDNTIIVIGGVTTKNLKYSKTVWIGVFK